MKFTILPLFCALLLSLRSFAADPTADTKATDIEHLKTIGTALTAYQKAKGGYPAELSDLVPDFLPDAKILVSPLGIDANPQSAKGQFDPKLPCSYCYLFSQSKIEGLHVSCRDFHTVNLQEYGATAPILQCYLYSRILNVSFAGDSGHRHHR